MRRRDFLKQVLATAMFPWSKPKKHAPFVKEYEPYRAYIASLLPESIQVNPEAFRYLEYLQARTRVQLGLEDLHMLRRQT